MAVQAEASTTVGLERKCGCLGLPSRDCGPYNGNRARPEASPTIQTVPVGSDHSGRRCSERKPHARTVSHPGAPHGWCVGRSVRAQETAGLRRERRAAQRGPTAPQRDPRPPNARAPSTFTRHRRWGLVSRTRHPLGPTSPTTQAKSSKLFFGVTCGRDHWPSGSRRKPRGCRATSETSGVARLRHTEPSEGSRDRVAAGQRHVS